MIGRVRWSVVLACVVGCSFRHGAIEHRDAPVEADATIDAQADAARPVFCPTDSHLRLCFSFDQDPLPTTLANEGAAQVSATLTNVTRAVGAGGRGGAALLDATSIIHLPATAQVTNIQAIEVWYRADAEPANGGRFGLVDSNVIPPNISLFVGRVDPTHQLRCGIGAGSGVADATLAVGTWYHVACVCDAGTLKMYVDGVKVGEPAASCASGGEVVVAGLTIGSNNNGGPTGVNDWLVGAVDGVRLWDVTLSAETVADHARYDRR
jgi:hypothetical protein